MNIYPRAAYSTKATQYTRADDPDLQLTAEIARIQNGIKDFADGARAANDALAARVFETEKKLARRGGEPIGNDLTTFWRCWQ